MPLLDHFHPPLHGPRRWEGFHHSWATFIAQQLNQDLLPPGYFAEAEISVGPELEVDVGTLEVSDSDSGVAVKTWSPPRAKMSFPVDFSHLDSIEVKVFQDLGGAELRAAVELISPANKDRVGSRRTFAAKCAGYLQRGLGLATIDVVTSRKANLHEELIDVLEIDAGKANWEPKYGLAAIAYRAVTVRKSPRIEVWPSSLTIGKVLPVLPLWLNLELCVPIDLEASYLATCRSLRISA